MWSFPTLSLRGFLRISPLPGNSSTWFKQLIGLTDLYIESLVSGSSNLWFLKWNECRLLKSTTPLSQVPHSWLTSFWVTELFTGICCPLSTEISHPWGGGIDLVVQGQLGRIEPVRDIQVASFTHHKAAPCGWTESNSYFLNFRVIACAKGTKKQSPLSCYNTLS